MSNHSQGRGINYFAVLHTSEAHMADTVCKLCKEEYYLPWYNGAWNDIMGI